MKVETTLQETYSIIKGFATQQQIADALKILVEANLQIKRPVINIEQIKPPSTNLNRKGRHSSKKGVKSGTKRLDIHKEHFEKYQQKEIKNKKKIEKEKVEIEKKRRIIELEERHLALKQKKRKLTFIVKNPDGVYIAPTNDETIKNAAVENPSLGLQSEIKHESQQHDG